MTRIPTVQFIGVLLLSTTALMCNGDPQAPVENASRGTGGNANAGSTNTGGNADAGVDADASTASIWETPPYGWADAEHAYQACPEIASGTGSAPVISDFNQNTLHVLANEGRGGVWYKDDDGSAGQLTVTLDSGALHVISADWSVWGAGIGLTIGPALSETMRCYYDASHYAGIRFRAKGSGMFRFNVGTFANYPVSIGGTCNQPGDNCLDWPGGTGKLTNEWQTYEFPFCALKSEGWGQGVVPLDPSQLLDMFFLLPKGGTKELWVDDLAFFTKDTAESPMVCDAITCPMDAVPIPATVRPETSWLPLTDEFTLHTFDQETTHCGPIRRRYLSFVPRDLASATNAPIVFALNGTGGDAESFRSMMTQGRLDVLAARDGAIVVYANAAPGPYSSDNPSWANADTWRHDTRDDGEVDDVAYITMVLDDMKQRNVISGDNDVYLLGLSIGGGMVLQIAKQMPERIKGIAPFMAYDGTNPTPVPALSCSGVSRILFGMSSDDPGLPAGYRDVLSKLPAEWATAAGLPQEVITAPLITELPNTVNEGADYSGTSPIALRTRNSHVTQTDMRAPGACARVRVLEFVNGGHLWPTPELGTKADLVDDFGFNNQDLDASDAVWEFFFDTQ
jgi:poly(3-hydroxybutyrate) depolymerase